MGMSSSPTFTDPILPGLIALHGNRSEVLAEAVLAWLERQPLAPLEEEVILVQSNGMAEWLKMTLAQQGGVCAAARVELPARFLWRTYRQVLGRDQVPAYSPLDKQPLTWRLMRLLPALLMEPGFEPVAGFLQPGEPDRLFQLASRLADLYDQYQVYRADWLDAWADGRDELPHVHGLARAVPADQMWQPRLWRAILSELSERERAWTRPRLHRQVLDTLQGGGPLASPVARRVVLFGMTAVPLPTLQTLAALAHHSQVMLAIPNPCRFHWADIIDGRELLRMARRRHPLRGGRDLSALPLEEMHAHAHPLLAAWGRQGRDFVRQLDEFDDTQSALERLPLPRVDLFDEDESADAPLLRQVQNRIRDLVPLAEHPAMAAQAADRSIVFHVAHGALREVEILHDQLLQLFARPPDQGRAIQPRDVVVMVPDIDQFAPAIRAVFGQYSRHDTRYIPFDIADLSARASSPLVTAMEWLLRISQQRCRMSELRDLLDVPAIAARFGLDADAMPRLTRWMAGAGIRWGLSAAQRDELGLGACGEQNTSWFGLQRMLLGYASGTAMPFAGIEPYAEVGGLDAELAGGLSGLLGALMAWWADASQPAAPIVWAERGRALLAAVFKPLDDADRMTLAALDQALNVWLDACEQAGFGDTAVPLSVAREAWLGALEEPTLNKRFRAGGVTFCTLMPMRAIPFEVVCLLGMNDGDYPRRSPRSDFDLMGLPGQVRPGDRSRRDDDRQLMLEALLSARQVLYVSWTGRSVRDNTEQPPSVLVSQLRDYLAAGWQGPVLAQRTTEHPLQPFSRRYFEPNSPLVTYAREWRAAHVHAEVSLSERAGIPALPRFEPDPHVPLTVMDLARFLRHPVRAFFRQRLGVVFESDVDEALDDEAFGLAGLEEYGLIREVSDAVLSQLPEGLPAAQAELSRRVSGCLESLQRSGRLPLGGVGERTLQALRDTVQPMLQTWLAMQCEHAEPAPRRRLHLTHGTVVLEDWLDHLRVAVGADGTPVWLDLDTGKVAVKRARVGWVARPDKLVVAWVRSLAAAACGEQVAGLLVGRDATLHVAPMDPVDARQTLVGLIDAWQEGLSRPLPVALRTALAALDAAGKPWQVYEGTANASAEREDPCLYRLYPDYEALCADGEFDGWAETLYGPLCTWIDGHVQCTMHPGAGSAEEGGAA